MSNTIYAECTKFNDDIPPGTEVDVTQDDGSIVRTKTRSVAWVIGGHSMIVKIDGRTGGYDCNRIKKATK